METTANYHACASSRTVTCFLVFTIPPSLHFWGSRESNSTKTLEHLSDSYQRYIFSLVFGSPEPRYSYSLTRHLFSFHPSPCTWVKLQLSQFAWNSSITDILSHVRFDNAPCRVVGSSADRPVPRDLLRTLAGYFSETSSVLCRHYGTERSHDSIKMFPLLGSNHPNMETIKGLSSLDYTPNQEILAVPHGTQTIPRLDREITTVPRLAEHS